MDFALAADSMSYVIAYNYWHSWPTSAFSDAIDSFVSQIERTLSERLGEDIRLDIFGSLISGFGTLDSDIDVCLRFKSKEQPEERTKKVVFTVAEILQKENFVKSAVPITHTKVPIIKCTILKPFATSMDISYYNTLALENTRLLATYCAWEPQRLPALGVWVKKWAKEGGICDASMGYLSSYGCILLLIHYLQNCDPPVLPRLQEDYDQEERKHFSGWNTYFYPIVEPNWSKNEKCLGELFFGFLDYYAKDFDYKKMVVQIRQKKPMKKMDKRVKYEKWHGRKDVLAIEDPFELDRNLCGGLLTHHFERIQTYFERSAKILRETVKSVDPTADEVDLKRQLNEVLKKCHVSSEEIRKKLKEDGAEDVKKKRQDKKVHKNRDQKVKKREAGALGFRQTSFQQAAIDEMDDLLVAMDLEKENFPALCKKGTEQDTSQSSAAEFWGKKPANNWRNVTTPAMQLDNHWEQRKRNALAGDVRRLRF